MTDEKQDLDNLLKHPGWLRVVEANKTDMQGRLNQAISNAASERDDVMALNLLRQCIAAKQALEVFVAWPESRLKTLLASEASRATTTSQLSRRGPL